ncbi:MAG: SulP family inorganic anion transporter, partial [Oscillospiraceae bacterium]|nr:SulP family inorganic anion transporter [Oscillospiraceae bacterium]
MRLITQIKTDSKNIRWLKDIFGGFVIALVSIPISMGYAQIAGLPPVCGLYGSLLPILLYGLLTTSRQFVVGVDAMPAVIVGSVLAQMGFAAESEEALLLVPVITLLTALWFLVLYFLKAGRIVRYISIPVMGGFISGVGLTIILMQVPKLFGGTPGTGELVSLLSNIVRQLPLFHPLSFSLG